MMASEQIERVLRVSDQLSTAYAILRDRYKRRALLLDVTILLVSVWLSTMVFVDPTIAQLFTPFKLSSPVWIGLLSTVIFALSIVQLRVDWKARADAYARSLNLTSTFVKGHRHLRGEGASVEEIGSALRDYDVLSGSLEPIPESEFLCLKQKHKIKLEISKYLDKRPAASLLLIKLRLWWRDNKCNRGKNDNRN